MASDQLKGFHPVSGDNYPFEVSFERSFQKVCHIRIVIHYENSVWSGVEYLFRGRLPAVIIHHQLVQISFWLADDFFRFLPQRQLKEKAGSGFFIILCADRAAVQFHQNLGVRQADSCSALFSRSLVEAGKELVRIHLFQSASLVDDGDTHPVFFRQQFRSNRYFRVLRTVFQGIDKQVT